MTINNSKIVHTVYWIFTASYLGSVGFIKYLISCYVYGFCSHTEGVNALFAQCNGGGWAYTYDNEQL